jgi:hypothetical protein
MPGTHVHSFYVNEEQRNTPLILLFLIGCLEQIKREAGAMFVERGDWLARTEMNSH